MGYFPHHSGQLNSPEAETIPHTVTETYPHMVTGASGETRHYPHMVTGATGETPLYPHMVTRGPEEIRHNPHTMTATQEESPYCSPTTSSGKQKKARSTNQPHFRSENTPGRQLRQTRFCWPSNNWRRTPIQPFSTKILAESRNCLNLSQRQCLRLTENQRNSNCLKIYSKRV